MTRRDSLNWLTSANQPKTADRAGMTRPILHRQVSWTDAASYRPDLPQELANSWAMPSARAGRASHRALLHGLGHTAPTAIAAFALLYFGGELLRAVLS